MEPIFIKHFCNRRATSVGVRPVFKPQLYNFRNIFCQFLPLQSTHYLLLQALFLKLIAKGLAQCCPTEPSAKMEIIVYLVYLSDTVAMRLMRLLSPYSM